MQVRISGGPENRILGQVCVPVRCDDELFGYRWLSDDDNSLSEVELQLASDAAPAAGQLLHRLLPIDNRRDSREQELLRDWVSEGSSIRSHAVDELAHAGTLPDESHAMVIGIHIGAHGSAQGAATELDLAPQRCVRISRRRQYWQRADPAVTGCGCSQRRGFCHRPYCDDMPSNCSAHSREH